MITLFRRFWLASFAIVACSIAFYQFDWSKLWLALPGTPVFALLSLMIAASLTVFAVCAVRWISINDLPFNRKTMLEVYFYVSFVIGASIVTPFQLGEFLKLKFANRAGLNTSRSIYNIVLERVLDLAAIAAMGVSGMVYISSGSLVFGILAMVSIFGSGALILMILPSHIKKLPQKYLSRFGAALSNISNLTRERLLLVCFATVMKWAITLFAWIEILQVLGIPLTLSEGLLLLGTVTALSILSLVPGGIGVQELSVRAVLISLGVEPLPAETAAIMLRMFTPVMVFLGILHLPFLSSSMQENKGAKPIV